MLPARLGRVGIAVVPLYAGTLFVSALLLFWVQPLIAKMMLPLLGGAPAVWNTAMMFFQLVLLGGYGYAHLVTRLRTLRVQAAVHLAVLAGGFVFLPFAIGADAAPPADGSPVFWELAQYRPMVAILEQLLGPSGVRLQSSKINLKEPHHGSPVEWHQDWGFYPHTNDDMLAVGVMLDDAFMENGPLMAVPGPVTSAASGGWATTEADWARFADVWVEAHAHHAKRRDVA